MEYRLKTEINNLWGLLAGFVFGLGALYLILWNIFMGKVLEQLWRSKFLLAIVPTEKVMENSGMREFIANNSNNYEILKEITSETESRMASNSPMPPQIIIEEKKE